MSFDKGFRDNAYAILDKHFNDGNLVNGEEGLVDGDDEDEHAGAQEARMARYVKEQPSWCEFLEDKQAFGAMQKCMEDRFDAEYPDGGGPDGNKEETTNICFKHHVEHWVDRRRKEATRALKGAGVQTTQLKRGRPKGDGNKLGRVTKKITTTTATLVLGVDAALPAAAGALAGAAAALPAAAATTTARAAARTAGAAGVGLASDESDDDVSDKSDEDTDTESDESEHQSDPGSEEDTVRGGTSKAQGKRKATAKRQVKKRKT
jgi:hypothetical protein